MKRSVLTILVILTILNLYGQGERPLAEGKVSYITLQNIYVKFETSGLVQPGDTVFIRKDQALVPLFVAESVSSLSCVGRPIAKSDIKPPLLDHLFFTDDTKEHSLSGKQL